MKTYDEMFTRALHGYGKIEEDRIAAATIGIATKDGLKAVTAVVDLDYHVRMIESCPDKERGKYFTCRARTEHGKMFRVYKTRFIDFAKWEVHLDEGVLEYEGKPSMLINSYEQRSSYFAGEDESREYNEEQVSLRLRLAEMYEVVNK